MCHISGGCVPRIPRQSRSGNSPFAFFAWLAHVPFELAERILSSPTPFGCPPVVGQGLRESAPPALRKRAPAKQKKQREVQYYTSQRGSSGKQCLGVRGTQQKKNRKRGLSEKALLFTLG